MPAMIGRTLRSAVTCGLLLSFGACEATPSTPYPLTRVLAEQGNAEAQFSLGVAYDTGQGVAQDSAEAARWYRLAADHGHAEAQFNLGVMYDEGKGVPQDYAEAAQWFRLAADHGHAEAQFNLGVMYDEGKGVPQDYAEAARWYQLAADRGFTEAQYNLGVKYDEGARRPTGRCRGGTTVPARGRPRTRLGAVQPRVDVQQRPRASRRTMSRPTCGSTSPPPTPRQRSATTTSRSETTLRLA